MPYRAACSGAASLRFRELAFLGSKTPCCRRCNHRRCRPTVRVLSSHSSQPTSLRAVSTRRKPRPAPPRGLWSSRIFYVLKFDFDDFPHTEHTPARTGRGTYTYCICEESFPASSERDRMAYRRQMTRRRCSPSQRTATMALSSRWRPRPRHALTRFANAEKRVAGWQAAGKGGLWLRVQAGAQHVTLRPSSISITQSPATC